MNPDYDYVLDHLVGGGGWWQWKQCLWLLPQHVSNGIPLLLHMFTAYTPQHRCFIDGCDVTQSDPNLFNQPFLEYSVPESHKGQNFLSEGASYDSCSMYQKLDTNDSCTGGDLPQCCAKLFSEASVNCSKYVYDNSEFVETITSRMDLVCANVGKRHLCGSFMMMGLMLGSLLGGPAGDRFGRKKAMFGAMLLVVPAVLLGGMVGDTDYFLYQLLRLISCTFIVFGWIASHNFQLEFFSKSYRKTAYVVNGMMGHITGLSLPLIIYFNRHWRFMHLWAGIATASGLPIFFVIPESPRWLVCNGKVSEAEAILTKAASVNGRNLTSDERAELHQVLKVTAEDASLASTDGEELGIPDLFSKSLRARTLTLFTCWISAIVASYAFTLNAEALSGDIFINFVLMSLSDLPSFLLVFLLIDRFGRRTSLRTILILLSACCLTMAAIPKNMSSLVLMLFLLGKCLASTAASICWLYTAELYPTNLRSQALGTCSMVARIFGMSSSFVSELSMIWGPLPMVVLGFPALAASCLAASLPETKGKALPETLEESLTIGLSENARNLPDPLDGAKLYSLVGQDSDPEDEDENSPQLNGKVGISEKDNLLTSD